MSYSLVYPPSHNDTYVKATTKYSTDFWPYYATDPLKSLTGTQVANSWASQNASTTNQRLHIDLYSAKIITRIYYENFHASGAFTTVGVKNFTFWGSNDSAAFATLTFGTDTNWTQLTTSSSQFDQHVSSNTVDPKYILVTNNSAYRYYAFKFADNWGYADFMGLRRVSLMKEDAYGASMIVMNENGVEI